MSHWNHRVIRQMFGGTHVDTIHEVYYRDDGSIYAYSKSPCYPYHDVENDPDWSIASELERFQKALTRRTLTEEDLNKINKGEKVY